ncbi:MAG: hypothetical protein ACRET4_03335 [Steroidobacteraceae bacterium]
MLRTLQVSPRHVNIRPVGSPGSDVSSMAYAFPVLEGEIFGEPTGTALTVVDVNRATFDLKLEKLWSAASAAAKPLTAEARQSGIVVTPAETGLLRVGTYLVDQDRQSLLLADVQFRDSMKDVPLILLYVDRPCHIGGVAHGARQGSDEVVDIDAALDSPGFHWLSYTRSGDGQALIRVHNGSDAVLLVVRPPAAQVASATPAPVTTDTQAN